MTRPLIAALARREIDRVEPILAEGVDVNATALDGDRETALMIAAGFGFVDVVERLLAVGADASIRDAWGRTACVWAAETRNVTLAERLWTAQSGRHASDLKSEDLVATRLDERETPQTRAEPYLVFYPHQTDHGGVRVHFLALGAAADRSAAERCVSDDNDRMVERGPYLLCRRISVSDEVRRRPTNPLASGIEHYHLEPSFLLVLADTPTATPAGGRSISRQRDPKFQGWTVIRRVFSPHGESAAQEAAMHEVGRSHAVQLEAICTCFEGTVEGHVGLIVSNGQIEVLKGRGSVLLHR